MRVFIILPVFLLIILFKLEQTNGNDCVCECCTSFDCNPTRIGSRPLWFCSEASSCTQAYCIDWYPDRCPPRNTIGRTRAICISNAERILPTLFIIIVFVPNSIRRPIQKMDYPLWNTTIITTPYRRPTTMPQIRLDWLEKMGLIKRTSTSTTTAYFFRPRF